MICTRIFGMHWLPIVRCRCCCFVEMYLYSCAYKSHFAVNRETMVTSIGNQHALCQAITTSIVCQCCLFCVDHNLESHAAVEEANKTDFVGECDM